MCNLHINLDQALICFNEKDFKEVKLINCRMFKLISNHRSSYWSSQFLHLVIASYNYVLSFKKQKETLLFTSHPLF